MTAIRFFFGSLAHADDRKRSVPHSHFPAVTCVHGPRTLDQTRDENHESPVSGETPGVPIPVILAFVMRIHPLFG